MPRARAQCLLIEGLKVLMVNHVEGGRSYWCLPGGGVDDGETPEQAAVRELKEECGLDALDLRQVSMIDYAEGGIHHTFLVKNYAGELTTGRDPELPSDRQIIQAAAWKHVDELSRIDLAFVVAGGLMTNQKLYRYLTDV